MFIFLKDSVVATLPWHDSDISSLAIAWSASGFATVTMVIEINPEESLQPLIDISINAAVIKIRFDKVWQFVSKIHGDVSPKEVILDWDIFQTSLLVQEILGNTGTHNVGLRHHQLHLSGGSILDIVFEEVCIEDFTDS
jgi:hypothetical protein